MYATLHWRFGRPGGTLPPLESAEHWLTAAEGERLRHFKIEKRRRDWLLGRLNLKALLVGVVADRWDVRLEPRHVWIDRLRSGAPCVRLAPGSPPVEAFREHDRLPLSVSNSHSDGHALGAALWTDALEAAGWTSAVGADLERIEPRSPAFVGDFLTSEERAFWNAATGTERDLRANLVWSAKEAVLKVLQRGLSADTWWLTCLPDGAPGGPAHTADTLPVQVTLAPPASAWRTFSTRCDPRLQAQHVQFAGRWCREGDFVLTLAVGLMSRAPQ
jgi:4'-phosphopantetheinyl transferase